MLNAIQNMRFLVVGASSGVGLETAKALSQLGASMVVSSRNEKKLQNLTDMNPEKIVPVAADISIYSECRQLVDAALSHLNHIDVVINTSGVHAPRRAFNEIENEDFEFILKNNTTGVFNLLRTYKDIFNEDKHKHLIQVSSVAGLRPSVLAGSAYTASKYAIEGMIKTINQESYGTDFKVSVISPGPIDTPLVNTRKKLPSDEERKMMLDPKVVADSILFAAAMDKSVCVENIVLMPSGLPRD